MPERVRLTEAEAALARAVGVARTTAQAEREHRCERLPGEDAAEADIRGAAGELAAAIVYGLPWTGCYYRELPRVKPPDIGQSTDVRTVAVYQRPRRLIVHPEDEDGWWYVLVEGESRDFLVLGSIVGARAKRQEWLENPHGLAPAYFVPRGALLAP